MMDTNAYRSFETNGTSALKAKGEAPRLVLIEGGRSENAVVEIPRVCDRADSAPEARFATSARSLVLAAFVGLAIAALIFLPGALKAQQAREVLNGAQTFSVKVASGDSLWSIASEHTPQGAETQDVVDWIRDANGLQTSMLVAGQQLTVPVA